MRLASLLISLAISGPALGWDPVAPGIRTTTFLDGAGQAFEVDLAIVELRVAEARALGRTTASVAELAKGSGARLAVNGGFFDDRSAPLGLLVSGSKTLSKLRRTDSGVLYIDKDHQARLVHASEYRPPAGVEFAVQASPRLVVSGEVVKLKPQWDRRTAIGIRADGRHVVLVVVREPVSLDLLAHALLDTLECPYALNLDGGSSTQLWANLEGAEAVLGFSVANAVLAVPRPAP